MQRQAIGHGKIFANHTSDKGLECIIGNKLSKLRSKKKSNNSIRKWAKRQEQPFHWKGYMAEKHMKGCWTPLAIIGVDHIRTGWEMCARSCSTPLRPGGLQLAGLFCRGISQARILEWVAISFSKGPSRLMDWIHVSYIGRQTLNHWATWKAISY